MRRLALSAIGLLIVAAVVIAAAGMWFRSWLATPLQIEQATVYELPKGTSMRALSQDLAARGMLEHPRLWTLYGRYTGAASRLRAGEYAVPPTITPAKLLDLFTSGDVVLHSLTIIEGTTFRDLMSALKRNTALKLEVSDLTEADIMRKLGKPDLHPEGQFYPDTYRFPRGTTDLELLKIAHRRLESELNARWAARAKDLPLASAYEALILASIVEKETALASERPLISGVFVQRLRRGMRLQTDPTVIYGMQEQYDGNIRRADLTRDTPYNTYTRAGLPPTPIATVGAESLDAAVRPSDTDALYFVATGDPDGSHYFSRTHAEHQAAVQRYLRKLRSRG